MNSTEDISNGSDKNEDRNEDIYDILPSQLQIYHSYNSNRQHNQSHSQSQDITALTRKHMTRASQMSNNGTVASLISKCHHQRLPYSIFDYSSYSGAYHPRNICVNQPTKQSSRWSSGSHDHEQFITIKFDKPVIARTITFGKFHKGHVCNLKEFKVYGGLEPNDELIELLHDGLKNDTEPETFILKYQCKDLILPVKYIKIVPLSAFGANFNYSIWYLELRGVLEEQIMQRVCTEYEQYKEAETTRLCLKYFRQKNMMDVFQILQKRTGVELEHPFVSELHRNLVVEANFEAAEQVLHQTHQRQIYQSFSDNSKYAPSWRQIFATNGNSPAPRGGHQMCIDVIDKKIYVLGGWDGRQDLADFWFYDLIKNTWQLISLDTQKNGGPAPRSCHKICFDRKSRSIFVLGRYLEAQAANESALESDFYRYYVEFDQWVKISDNTANDGGPDLIYDHQMCVDPKGAMLYVFGGKTVTGESVVQSYSGLYSYSISSNQWRLIRHDDLRSSEHISQPSVPLKSRVGHSMVFDETNRSLYVFAGQRVKDYLSDLYRYEVDQDIVTEIAQDASKDSGPDAGFTQRATLDESLDELYVFSGYIKNTGSDGVKNSFWVYSIKKNKWQKVYQSENKEDSSLFEPCPRFAHQMVYDPTTKTQYIFGGNPGDRFSTTKRLNDFWEFTLTKPNPSGILRKSLFKIRMQRLRELCSKACDKHECYDNRVEANSDMLVALEYLRNQVAPVVDHEDEKESKEFHQICANLCLLETMMDGSTRENVLSNVVKSEDLLYAERTRLFELLLEYIPQEMKEPPGKLTNAVKLS